MYPLLKDMLSGFQSIEELRRWATQNRLLDHPFVRERLCSHANLPDILNQFNNAEDLTQWAIHNLLINHQQILDKLDSLLTCPLCGTRLLSTKELRRHEETHHYTGQPGHSLVCSWCKLKLNSHSDLRQHEEFHRVLDECYDLVNVYASEETKDMATPVVQQIGAGESEDEENPTYFDRPVRKYFQKIWQKKLHTRSNSRTNGKVRKFGISSQTSVTCSTTCWQGRREEIRI